MHTDDMRLPPVSPMFPVGRIALLAIVSMGLASCAPMAGGAAARPILEAAFELAPDPTETPVAPPASGEDPQGPATPPTLPADGLPGVIGSSVAGRPLEVFRFGRGEREFLITAGIHGGYEWNTIELADELIAWLRREPERVPEDVSLYILRAMNPDGEARSRSYSGRANENGVDLNRNWPVNWHPDWDLSACWRYLPISGGPHPASEPEVVAVMRFMLEHDFEAVISYHSAALGIFPGGEPPDIASQNLAEAIAAVSGYPYPPLDYGCEYTGSFADWSTSQGIAAVDVELSTHDSVDFDLNVMVLDTFLRWRP